MRTTHISGNLTDAGVYLGKHLRGEKQDAWKMFFYIYNIFSFFLGNFWGAEEFIKRGESCLLIAATLYFIIGSFYFILRELHQQIKRGESSLENLKTKKAELEAFQFYLDKIGA